MALKSYKPTTPGQRGLVLIDRSELWKGRPVKSLTEGLTGKGGRNNTGRITMRRRGGGVKRLYRVVDFRRAKLDVPAKVIRIEYDPNRTAFIALVGYADGEQAYILAPQRLAPGDTVISAAKADIKPGNAMPFTSMPIGTIVHNVEMKPGKGGQIARSAGTYAQFVGRDGGYAEIRLSSGELRMVRRARRSSDVTALLLHPGGLPRFAPERGAEHRGDRHHRGDGDPARRCLGCYSVEQQGCGRAIRGSAQGRVCRRRTAGKR
jgi:large subunit ribosomal protein L2